MHIKSNFSIYRENYPCKRRIGLKKERAQRELEDHRRNNEG